MPSWGGRNPDRAAPPVVPSTYTLFVVPALAAAVVGKFQHLVPTAIAGIGIGMLQAWLIYLSGEHSWMPQSGVGEMVPLVVMLIASLITSRGFRSAAHCCGPIWDGPRDPVRISCRSSPASPPGRSRCS